MPKTGKPRCAYDEREAKFVNAMATWAMDNPPGAAAIAGYERPHAAATRLLKKPIIAAAIQARREMIESKIPWTDEQIVNEIANIAFANLFDVVDIDENGRPRVKRDISKEAQRTIAQVSESAAGIVTIRQHDRMAALKLLAQIRGLYTSKTRHEIVAGEGAAILLVIPDNGRGPKPPDPPALIETTAKDETDDGTSQD